jgi:hypothetical protein
MAEQMPADASHGQRMPPRCRMSFRWSPKMIAYRGRAWSLIRYRRDRARRSDRLLQTPGFLHDRADRKKCPVKSGRRAAGLTIF